MRLAASALALSIVAACGGSSEPPPPAAVATTTLPAAESGSPRTPDEAGRAAMIELLRTEAPAGDRVWFVIAAGVPEPAALAASLEAIFREAGWQPQIQRLTGMMLKQGPVRILVGEEQEHPTVDIVRRALSAGGIVAETGTGYRAFFEEKKRENPAWPGVPMAPEQGFLVVIAPQAAA